MKLAGPGVVLTLCCFVVYSTRRFVLSLALCYFVLVFFSPFSIAITSLGEETANLSAFHTFVRFALVWFYLFPLPLCLERAAACDCGTPWTFLLPFLLSTYCFSHFSYFSMNQMLCLLLRSASLRHFY